MSAYLMVAWQITPRADLVALAHAVAPIVDVQRTTHVETGRGYALMITLIEV